MEFPMAREIDMGSRELEQRLVCHDPAELKIQVHPDDEKERDAAYDGGEGLRGCCNSS